MTPIPAAIPPVPAATATEAASASVFLDKVARWDRSSPGIKEVLNAAFRAKDYLECIKDLRAKNINPQSYLDNLDVVSSCLILGGPSVYTIWR